MNVLVLDQATFLHKFPLWVIELTITIIFFSLWIIVTEWLLHYIAGIWGEDVLDEFRFLNQFFTLLIAIGLAVMFNAAFSILWHWMESVWDNSTFEMPPLLSRLANPKRRANNSITVMALMAAYYLASNKRASQRLQQVHINEERLEKENIKVNAVSPGFTATALNNFQGTETIEEGSREPIRVALELDGPTGTFTGPGGAFPW